LIVELLIVELLIVELLIVWQFSLIRHWGEILLPSRSSGCCFGAPLANADGASKLGREQRKSLSLNKVYSCFMNWKEHIVSDPDILLGKPTIKGTRISVDHLVSLLAQGWDEQKILANHPRLTRESFLAVYAFIHDCLKDGLLYPVRTSA
jgi:uncharacterized protein (DUF433 family)